MNGSGPWLTGWVGVGDYVGGDECVHYLDCGDSFKLSNGHEFE